MLGVKSTDRARYVRAIRKALSMIVGKAVSVDAEKSQLPRNWLFHNRWGKVDGAKTARGEAIEFTRIGGRTTAFVPSRQRWRWQASFRPEKRLFGSRPRHGRRSFSVVRQSRRPRY